MLACMVIKLGDHVHATTLFNRNARPQVQQRLGLPHPMVGFNVRLPIPTGVLPAQVLDLIQVYGGPDAHQLSGPFSKELLKPR